METIVNFYYFSNANKKPNSNFNQISSSHANTFQYKTRIISLSSKQSLIQRFKSSLVLHTDVFCLKTKKLDGCIISVHMGSLSWLFQKPHIHYKIHCSVCIFVFFAYLSLHPLSSPATHKHFTAFSPRATMKWQTAVFKYTLFPSFHSKAFPNISLSVRLLIGTFEQKKFSTWIFWTQL